MAPMAAQDAVLLRAEPGDGVARGQVEPAGLEADADAAHGLEGVTEQQQLGLGVETGALHARGVPGVTDLHARNRRVEVVIARTTDDVAASVAYHERHRLALRLHVQ